MTRPRALRRSARGLAGLAAWALGACAVLAVSASLAQAPPPATSDGAALFDQVWDRFDAVYPYFTYKGIDWDAFRARHRPFFATPMTPDTFAHELAAALSELHDLHVQVQTPDGTYLQVYNPGWARNFTTVPRNRYATAPYETLGAHRVVWHTWLTGHVAYLRIDTFVHADFSDVDEDAVDALFARYADAAGMILDERPNTGGDEDIARWFAERVVDGTHVYGAVRYRNGPGHDDLGEPTTKVIEPGGAHRFTGPVVALIGPFNMSSAEWFALMLDTSANVTLVGAPTLGSTGNPERLELSNGVVVGIPRWFALRPDGTPIEGHGVTPDVLVAPGDSFDEAHDYVVERALSVLGGS